MLIFLSIIIVVITIMVLADQIGGKKKKKRGRLTKRQKERLNAERINETQKLIEKFSKLPSVSKAEIETCNKILIDFEDKCNCFVDNDHEFPL